MPFPIISRAAAPTAPAELHAISTRTGAGSVWHTLVGTDTAAHALLSDARAWARSLGATSHEVPDFATLTAEFRAAGRAGGLKDPKVQLIAQANRVDNFTLYIAGAIDDGIIGAVSVALDDTARGDDLAEWLNMYVDDPTGRIVTDGSGYSGHRPASHPLVRGIAAEIHKEFNK